MSGREGWARSRCVYCGKPDSQQHPDVCEDHSVLVKAAWQCVEPHCERPTTSDSAWCASHLISASRPSAPTVPYTCPAHGVDFAGEEGHLLAWHPASCDATSPVTPAGNSAGKGEDAP